MASTDSSECRHFFSYKPSFILATIGCALFILLVAAHIFRTLRTRTWCNSFFILGGVCQLFGCVARATLAKDECNAAAFRTQSVLLRLGPTFLMFTVTWLHTTTIEVLQAQRFCWVPFRFQRFGYTITNVVLALLQLTGSIDMVALATRWGANLGADLIIASYVTQMVFWLFIFAENTFVVIKTKGAIKRAERLDMSAGMPEPTILSVYRRYPNFQRWNQVIGLAIMIIGTGRNLMRLTELGVQMLRDTEWMTYAFDIYQMVIVMGAYAAFYLPGKLHEVKTTSLGQYCELAQAPDRV